MLNLKRVLDKFTKKQKILLGIVVVFLLGSIILGLRFYLETRDIEPYCTVQVIKIKGNIETYLPPDAYDEYGDVVVDSTSVEEVQKQLDRYRYSRGFIFEVDSPGGSIVAGEAISKIIKNLSQTTVAVVGYTAASAAYEAISSTEVIFASKYSQVGGIGVTMSYLDETETNAREGKNYVELSTGKFKDARDPDKPITPEERTYFKEQLTQIHNMFVSDIADNRELSMDHVAKLADGSTYLGEKAKELGLIDEIGGRAEALTYLQDRVDWKVRVCE